MLIDCDTCQVRGPACGDCVVSFLTISVRPDLRVVPPRPAQLQVDAAQAAAMDAFAKGGLVPPLRLSHGA